MGDIQGANVFNDLMGDLYEASVKKDVDSMHSTISEIQSRITDGAITNDEFKAFFNNVFSGRGAVNMSSAVREYTKESIIKELIQNIFGCKYETNEIKLILDFKLGSEIKFIYNEAGFTLSDFIFFLSVGYSNADKTREGRFGVGAKAVFNNCAGLRLRSNTFYMELANNSGKVYIDKLELTAPYFKGTEMSLFLLQEDYDRIKDSIANMVVEKGVFINIADFCFAFLRKQKAKLEAAESAIDNTFNLAIAENGRPKKIYKIALNKTKSKNSQITCRFFENNKGIIDFIWYENEGYVYLIPFAISGSKRDGIVKMLSENYNYFSTFELTGFASTENESHIKEKLFAFFISVPNNLITSQRTGIKSENEALVFEKISKDISVIIETYKKYFVLDLEKRTNLDLYYFSPHHYVFEFFFNYINSSKVSDAVKNKFFSLISIKAEDENFNYELIRDNAFTGNIIETDRDGHTDKSARTKIEEQIKTLREFVSNMDNSVIASKYKWRSEEDLLNAGEPNSGEEFIYEFKSGGNSYVVDSDFNPHIVDYNLCCIFKNAVRQKVDSLLRGGNVQNENALDEILTMLDEMYGEDYRIDVKYCQLVVSAGGETYKFDLSKINIENLKHTYQIISQRERRFAKLSEFNEICSFIVECFTSGKDVLTYMRLIKAEGTSIGLKLDINKRYRFICYNKNFMIPSSITCSQLIEIVGNVYFLLNCGIMTGRLFDFDFSNIGYSFDIKTLKSLFSRYNVDSSTITKTLDNFKTYNLGVERLVLLDKSNKVLCIISSDDTISDENMEKAESFILLTEEASKPTIARHLELSILGFNKDILFKHYSGTEEPGQVLLDQVPYYLKPLSEITKTEFNMLRELNKKIRGFDNPKLIRDYYAKDINSKLFGYGTICPHCGYESDVVNCFVMKDFNVGTMHNDTEKEFKFSIYMCANDIYKSSSWLLNSLHIGGMSPFLWLEKLDALDVIPIEFFYASITFSAQQTYSMAVNSGKEFNDSHLISKNPETFNFILTPLMAAKWYSDNVDIETDDGNDSDDNEKNTSDSDSDNNTGVNNE